MDKLPFLETQGNERKPNMSVRATQQYLEHINMNTYEMWNVQYVWLITSGKQATKNENTYRHIHIMFVCKEDYNGIRYLVNHNSRLNNRKY